MKFTIFLEYVPPYQGSDRAIFELTQYLKKSKIELNYIVIPPLRALWELNKNLNQSKRLKYLYNLKRKTSKEVQRIILPNWILKCWKKNLYISYILTFIYILLTLIKLKKKIDSEINIINHPSPFSGLISFLFLKIFRKKILMGCPDLISSYGIDIMEESKSTLKGKGLIYLEKILTLFSDKIFTINNYIRDHLIKLGIKKEKINIIPNAVDIHLFNPNIDNSEFIKKFNLKNSFFVTYVGHIENWAGINLIIDSAKLLYNSNPDIQFLFIGDGNERIKLMNANIQANLKFLGLQPYELIPFFIKSSDIAIVTFPNTLTSHAASPIKVFEYMAMEKPIISTYLEGLKDVIISYKNGIFMYKNEPEELKNKIIELFENEKLRIELGLAARKTIIEEYNLNLISKKFQKLCYSILKRKLS